MLKEHDVVKHRVSGVDAGSAGTIVICFPENSKKYLVEFPEADGFRSQLLTLDDDDVEQLP